MYVAVPCANYILICADSENYSIAVYIGGWVIIIFYQFTSQTILSFVFSAQYPPEIQINTEDDMDRMK